MDSLKNWAGNLTYGAKTMHRPATLEEAQEIVAKARKVRPLGTRHSFNSIADTDADLLSSENLDRIVSLDRERRQVTVEGGLPYGRLCQWLDKEGFAIPNLASLPHISVAGACATATHGSGERNGNLATAVAALEIVTADGSLVRFERGDESFPGAVVNLGGLGLVARVTLDLQPAFTMRQYVYENLPFASLAEAFDAIEASAYSVSLFTRWAGPTVDQIWLKCRDEDADPGPDLFGAKPAPENRHPIPGVSAENCTEQMGVPGPWYERLPISKWISRPATETNSSPSTSSPAPWPSPPSVRSTECASGSRLCSSFLRSAPSPPTTSG